MRGLYLISVLALLLPCTGCSDDPSGLLAPDAAVEQYMDALVAGTYADWELPDFGPDQIPALLGYAEDTTPVEVFPRNSISSFYQPECSLGMLALWTVESIRVRDLPSTPPRVGRFPSQNPVLALRASPELELVTGYDDQLGAARAYRNWWDSRILLGRDFEKLRQIDPLAGTSWRWH